MVITNRGREFIAPSYYQVTIQVTTKCNIIHPNTQEIYPHEYDCTFQCRSNDLLPVTIDFFKIVIYIYIYIFFNAVMVTCDNSLLLHRKMHKYSGNFCGYVYGNLYGNLWQCLTWVWIWNIMYIMVNSYGNLCGNLMVCHHSLLC